MSTWWSHFAVRQPNDCKNSDPTLSFFLPSLDTFFYSLLPYLLSEDFISEYIIILFHLSFFSVTLSSLSFCSEFHFAVHVIKFSFFLFSSQHPLAVTVSRRTSRLWRLPYSLNSHASPVSRLRRRTLHFFRNAYVSGPVAAASCPLALLIFLKNPYNLPRCFSSSYSLFHSRIAVLLFLFRLIDLRHLPFLRLLLSRAFSSSEFRSPFPAAAATALPCGDEISVHQRQVRRSHLEFLRYRRQTPWDELAICISKPETAQLVSP